MILGKLIVLTVAVLLAAAGLGAALSDPHTTGGGGPIDLDGRKTEPDDGDVLADEDADDDPRDGANTRAPAPIVVGDGDNTRGDDGTSSGANTRAAEAPAPAPASPAPAPTDGGDDTGGDATSVGGSTRDDT